MNPVRTLLARLSKPSNWPLIAKFAMGPAIALGVLIVLTLVGVSALRNASDATQHVVRVDMRYSTTLGEVEREFERADSDLYRLLTAKAADPTRTDDAARVALIQARLDRVEKTLKMLLNSEHGMSDQRRLTAALRDVVEYKKAIEVVTTMLDVDFATSVSMIEPFQKNAARVSKLMNAVARDGLAQSERRARAVSDNVSTTILAFVALALMAVLGIAAATFQFGVRTVRSIRGIADATSRLAAADYSIDTVSLSRGDELGAVVSALETFRTQALETRRLQEDREQLRRTTQENERRRGEEARAAELAQRQRDEEVRECAAIERRAMLDELAREFERSISSVIEAVSRSTESLFESSERLKATAERTHQNSTVMGVESREVAHAMQTVVSATDELAMSFGEIERQVTGSRDAASTALRESETARETVAMLASEAERIEAVVQMINQIAARTNLLALNATIEAARAGEAGRGFAVVANEVKTLAGQTGSATNEVRGQISGIQSSAKHVVGTTTTINSQIGQLNGVVREVATSVQEQSRAAAEITHTIVSAMTKTRELVDRSREIRDAADANSDAADNVRAAVNDLRASFKRLRVDADRFVSHIQAA